MSKDNMLLNLAALEVLSEGSAGNVTGLLFLGALLVAPPLILWGVLYKLPKEFFKRRKKPTGEAYYQLLGLSPKTVERIKRRCADK